MVSYAPEQAIDTSYRFGGYYDDILSADLEAPCTWGHKEKCKVK